MGAKLASLSGVLGATQDRGLSFITSSTFSAASTVSVDGCFTASHTNYRVILDATLASGAANLTMRFRASGVDDSSTNYQQQYQLADNTSVSGARTTALGSVRIGSLDTGITFHDIGIYSPQVASATGIYADDHQSASLILISWAGRFTASTQFDGLTIYPSASTFTGSLAIYGYRKS